MEAALLLHRLGADPPAIDTFWSCHGAACLPDTRMPMTAVIRGPCTRQAQAPLVLDAKLSAQAFGVVAAAFVAHIDAQRRCGKREGVCSAPIMAKQRCVLLLISLCLAFLAFASAQQAAVPGLEPSHTANGVVNITTNGTTVTGTFTRFFNNSGNSSSSRVDIFAQTDHSPDTSIYAIGQENGTVIQYTFQTAFNTCEGDVTAGRLTRLGVNGTWGVIAGEPVTGANAVTNCTAGLSNALVTLPQTGAQPLPLLSINQSFVETYNFIDCSVNLGGPVGPIDGSTTYCVDNTSFSAPFAVRQIANFTLTNTTTSANTTFVYDIILSNVTTNVSDAQLSSALALPAACIALNEIASEANLTNTCTGIPPVSTVGAPNIADPIAV
eukprot:jgi/Chlat1/3725/Chrsp259S03879